MAKDPHKELSVSRIFRVNPSTIQRERLLVNLLPKLKSEGAMPSAQHNLTSLPEVLGVILGNPLVFQGFERYPELTQAWIKDELADFVFRDVPGKEKFASLRPLSLNAYKASVRQVCRDYGVSDQVYALLQAVDQERSDKDEGVVKNLRQFLAEGHDPMSDRITDNEKMELLVWFIAAITNFLPKDIYDNRSRTPYRHPPMCKGQGRILADDIDRLLAYRKVMSRTALLEGLMQIMCLHIGLYLLRLEQMVPDLVSHKKLNAICRKCPVRPEKDFGYDRCHYKLYFQMDMAQGYSNELARLSMQSLARHERQLGEYIHALFHLRKMSEFVEDLRFVDKDSYTVEDLFMNLSDTQRHQQDIYFSKRIEELKQLGGGEEEYTYYEKDALPYYVELVNQAYNKYHLNYYRRLFSSLFGKNRSDGIMLQGGRFQKYSLGSALLDTMVHVALVERIRGQYRSRRLRVDQFLSFLQHRYGFYIIETLPELQTTNILVALRANNQLLLQKLQEIGYYLPLSDAYNTQWLQPRYELEGVN